MVDQRTLFHGVTEDTLAEMWRTLQAPRQQRMRYILHGQHERRRGVAACDLTDNVAGCGKTGTVAAVFARHHKIEQAGGPEPSEVLEGKRTVAIVAGRTPREFIRQLGHGFSQSCITNPCASENLTHAYASWR